MKKTYATVLLQNGIDISDFRNGRISENQIHQLEVKVVANSISVLPAINENIRQVLNLPIVEMRQIQFLDRTVHTLPIVSSIIVKYFDRFSWTNAIVLPDDQEPLLGAIPLEEMDLYIHPSRNVLLPVHPEGPVMSLK
jgi:hypothetical protein